MNVRMTVCSCVLAAALAAHAAAQAHVDDLWISRWGYGGVLGYRPDGTLFAAINSPTLADCIGVTAIGDDRVAVTRRTAPDRVTVFDATGAITIDFALPEVTWSCGDLARFADGSFAVCDPSGDVEVYSASGAHLATWDAPELLFPLFAWVDVHDRLWISDLGTYGTPGGRVLAFDRGGVLVHDSPVAFDPGDLVVEPNGEIWVTDRIACSIVHLGASGAVLGSFPTGLGGTSSGLAMATDGTLWTNSETWAIARHFARDGSYLGEFVIALGVGRAMLMDVVRIADPPERYCTAGTTTNGCNAAISGVGVPSLAAASGFDVVVDRVEGRKDGILFYGISGAVAWPWGASSSYLCVAPPMVRMGQQDSGGTADACDGVLRVDLLEFVTQSPGAPGTPFRAGDKVWLQGWFRDPPSVKTTHMSDGLEVTFAP